MQTLRTRAASWRRQLDGDWGLALRNILWPQFCKTCGVRILTEENFHFCPSCWEATPRIEPPLCPTCGKPHDLAQGFMALPEGRLWQCGACLSAKGRLPFRYTIAAAVYTGCAAEAVKLLKFQGRKNLADPLARLLHEALESMTDCTQYHALVPVPLHRVRQRERGFNQSALLAQGIAPALPQARLDESLLRTRPTQTQSLLKDPEERRANVRGAFAAAHGATFKGENVLLVDDVVTTHGTVAECARVLKRAGAKNVDVATVCLALRAYADPDEPTRMQFRHAKVLRGERPEWQQSLWRTLRDRLNR